jgi:hypothetical protein
MVGPDNLSKTGEQPPEESRQQARAINAWKSPILVPLPNAILMPRHRKQEKAPWKERIPPFLGGLELAKSVSQVSG